MLQNNKKRNQGFTIIEVLIVLAIAGLIMLIVFLAVPALRRNSNNTGIRNDASKILSSVSELVSNKQGTLPATTDEAGIKANANTKQTIKVVDKQAGVLDAAAETVQVVKQVKCADGPVLKTDTIANIKIADNKLLVTDSTSRDYAVIYYVEAAGGKYTNQCLSN